MNTRGKNEHMKFKKIKLFSMFNRQNKKKNITLKFKPSFLKKAKVQNKSKAKPKVKKRIIIKRSIKRQLIIMMMILTIIPLISVGAFSFYSAKNTLHYEVERATIDKMELAEKFISSKLSVHEEQLKLIANNSTTRTIESVQSEEGDSLLQDSLVGYVGSSFDTYSAYLKTESGRVFESYDTAYISNENRGDWYNIVKEKEDTYWSSLFHVDDTKQIITVAVPVFNYVHRFIGAIGTEVDLGSINYTVNNLKIGERGYIYIIDRHGIVISHPNKEFIGKKLEIKKVLDEVKDKEEGIYDYSYTKDNQQKREIAVYKTIEKTGWKIIGIIDPLEIAQMNQGILRNSVLAIIICTIVILFIAILFTNRFTKPIMELTKGLEEVRKGNFSIKVKKIINNEIGSLVDSFNDMVEGIGNLINNSKEMSQQLATTSKSMVTNSERTNEFSISVNEIMTQIATGASEQARDAEKEAELAHELDKEFEDLTSNSQKVMESVTSVVNTSDKSARFVEELKVKNKENNDSTQNITNEINELKDKITNIDSILANIKDIAKQTNLLSLNASIESAKAGEYGAGFAVVANEIRQLAQRTSEATKEIQFIIETLETQAENAVNAVDEVKNRSIKQTEAVEHVERSFIEVSQAIAIIRKSANTMFNSIDSMKDTKNTIVESINNISSVAEETSSVVDSAQCTIEEQNKMIESITEQAEQLSSMAQGLEDNANKFKL